MLIAYTRCLIDNNHLPITEELVIIGGASIYEQFLPHATHLVLTNLDKHYHCDTFFPTVDFSEWNCTAMKVLKPSLPGVTVNYWERKSYE
ncbi:dihydrofolate reductase [Vitreoscilla massiliensis]|uniref:dihydrofolate reductase n=1 Tax=Vitreoscilla massiliensis TaxID=1689272 RepID=UPI003899D615